MAGFECATGVNERGEWIDQIQATEHDRFVDHDYALLARQGIATAREAVRWPLVDKRGRYDFRSVAPFIAAARRHRIELIWDLFHYGYPLDVDLFHPDMPARFAEYCRAVARYIHAHSPGPYWFTPVNEPSYFSWAGGEVGRFAPHQKQRGFELKVALTRAALAAIPAIRDACPGARIVNVDPICRVVAPAEEGSEGVARARSFNEHAVFQFFDMVSGRMMPELGGSPGALDVVGLNYYAVNQWELGRECIPLADDDPRRVPLADIVRGVVARYGRPIVITETSDCDDRRSAWLAGIARTARELLDDGVDLGGVCIYPILGMLDWHDRGTWLRMGAWDLELDGGRLVRKPNEAVLGALRAAQGSLTSHRPRRVAGAR
jgi:beta-glucosidase/6-phospho-beta-glucosidase/beta-galactosidase